MSTKLASINACAVPFLKTVPRSDLDQLIQRAFLSTYADAIIQNEP